MSSDHAMHMCACVAVSAGAACMGVRPSAVSVAGSPSKAAEMADMFLTAIMLVHVQYVLTTSAETCTSQSTQMLSVQTNSYPNFNHAILVVHMYMLLPPYAVPTPVMSLLTHTMQQLESYRSSQPVVMPVGSGWRSPLATHARTLPDD